MQKLTNSEIDYIKNNLTTIIEDLKKYDTSDEEYKRYLDNLGVGEINDIKFLIANIDKMNTDENINDKVLDQVYWILGMWVFGDYRFSREEVEKYISDEIWLDIYEKILDTFED